MLQVHNFFAYLLEGIWIGNIAIFPKHQTSSLLHTPRVKYRLGNKAHLPHSFNKLHEIRAFEHANHILEYSLSLLLSRTWEDFSKVSMSSVESDSEHHTTLCLRKDARRYVEGSLIFIQRRVREMTL